MYDDAVGWSYGGGTGGGGGPFELERLGSENLSEVGMLRAEDGPEPLPPSLELLPRERSREASFSRCLRSASLHTSS